MADLPSGPLTLLFTDIEGSTRLLVDLGEAYTDLLGDHQRLLRTAFAAHGGLEVLTDGDAFFVVFLDPVAAVGAAADAQRALAHHPWPTGHPVRVRIGIHTGRAVATAHGYVGIDVHRAARISDAGHGGQVLVSEATRVVTHAALPMGITLEDLGRHRLKDIGVEHIWQLRVDDLPHAFPPLRSLEAHPSNLPAAPGAIVDRESERREIGELLSTARVVTIVGPGGIGKSRVAIEVAREALPRFPDGVFHLDLAPYDAVSPVAMALADVLGLQPPADSAPTDLVVEHLRERTILLLLDTAERVAGLGGLVGAIANRCPGVRMLITSRSPIRLSLEREFPLGPLSVEASGSDGGPAPAVELFLDRARAVRPDLPADEATGASIEAICRRLEGLPLAIELAAARVRVLSPAAIEGRLGQALPLLAGGPADAPSRQRTLRDTIGWSVGLLDPDDRTVMEDLSVFMASFDVDAAAAVAGAVTVDVVDALTVIERLVESNLLAIEPGDEPRFRFHALIREYALEALDARDPAGAARDRYAWYWLAEVRRRAEATGPAETAAVASVRRDQADIGAAIDRALAAAADDPEQAALTVGLTGSLGKFWWLMSRARDGSALLERALAVGGTADRALAVGGAPDPADLARARYWSGVLADELGQCDLADLRLGEALELYEGLGDELGAARTLNSRGVVARSMGDLDRAERLLTDSLERKRAMPGQPALATSLHNLAVVASDRDDHGRAIELYEQAVALDEAAEAEGSAAFTRLDLGAVRIRSGDLDRGVAEVLQTLPRLLDLDADDAIAGALEALAEAALRRVATPRAARLQFAADRLRARVGVPLPPVERPRVDATRSAIESALDPAELAAARSDADVMDAAAAVSFAVSD